jgi:cytochrome c556
MRKLTETSMHHTPVAIFFVASLLVAVPSAMAGHDDLPAGPIHDRHELMEDVGGAAKKIGGALKSGDFAPVPAAADEIHALAGKASALFPEGSTHPNSRALPEIWQKWDEFDKIMKEMEATAAALATAAREGGDVGAAANAMFGSCKSCHDQFRAPEED